MKILFHKQSQYVTQVFQFFIGFSTETVYKFFCFLISRKLVKFVPNIFIILYSVKEERGAELRSFLKSYNFIFLQLLHNLTNNLQKNFSLQLMLINKNIITVPDYIVRITKPDIN